MASGGAGAAQPQFPLVLEPEISLQYRHLDAECGAGLAGADPDRQLGLLAGSGGLCGSIPFLLFTLFGGVIADRVNKRKLLLMTQTVMMMLAFVLAALTWLKMITVWEVVGLAFLNGMAMAMNAPSYQALVPRLVPRKDLTNAIALNSAQFNMSRILGPTLGGYAMASLGMAGNFFLNGLSFLAVLFALMRIQYPEQVPEHHPSCSPACAKGLAICAASRKCTCWCG